MHLPDAFFISDTPDVTALIFVNLYLVVSLITLANDVFPHPGGPHRMILESLSAFIVLYNILSFPNICSCPTYSSNVFGLILNASGLLKSIIFLLFQILPC